MAEVSNGADRDRRRARAFYRIVKSHPPTLDDFASNAALGRRPARSLTPEQRRQWDGLSVFATKDQAERQVRARPSLGHYVAEIRLPEGGLLHFERTNPRSPGHYTLLGSAADVLSGVAGVTLIETSAGEEEPT